MKKFITSNTLKNISGVPDYDIIFSKEKKSKYALCIPILNENPRIIKQLTKIKAKGIHLDIDIVICDGGSTDGGTEIEILQSLGVNTLLVKIGKGKLSAQLRMGFYFCLNKGYQGIITVDGNNKDSVESIPFFIQELDNQFDYIQGSRFIEGGKHTNTPLSRYLAIKLIHAPLISFCAKFKLTDTTNGFRAYSKKYLEDKRVDIFRELFDSYELLFYLSVRASQLNFLVKEIPVERVYPKTGKTPTKISPIKGNLKILVMLFSLLTKKYYPDNDE